MVLSRVRVALASVSERRLAARGCMAMQGWCSLTPRTEAPVPIALEDLPLESVPQPLVDKVREQARRLVEQQRALQCAIAYGRLCEQRLRQLDPSHALPVVQAHISTHRVSPSVAKQGMHPRKPAGHTAEDNRAASIDNYADPPAGGTECAQQRITGIHNLGAGASCGRAKAAVGDTQAPTVGGKQAPTTNEALRVDRARLQKALSSQREAGERRAAESGREIATLRRALDAKAHSAGLPAVSGSILLDLEAKRSECEELQAALHGASTREASLMASTDLLSKQADAHRADLSAQSSAHTLDIRRASELAVEVAELRAAAAVAQEEIARMAKERAEVEALHNSEKTRVEAAQAELLVEREQILDGLADEQTRHKVEAAALAEERRRGGELEALLLEARAAAAASEQQASAARLQVRASQQLSQRAVLARRAASAEAETAQRARTASFADRDRISFDLRFSHERVDALEVALAAMCTSMGESEGGAAAVRWRASVAESDSSRQLEEALRTFELKISQRDATASRR